MSRVNRVAAGLATGAAICVAALVAGSTPASANYPYPPGAPEGVRPMVTDSAPPWCVTGAPAGTVISGIDVGALCNRAMAAAPTTAAAGAIRFGFSKLGTPYSQNYSLRATTYFDCSSFVARSLNAGGAKIRKSDGTFVAPFPYFGWTGAYVRGGYNYGYRDTNLLRLTDKGELRPGDIMIQFDGVDPANSAGNSGHAMMYLGEGLAIQAGRAPDGSSKVSIIRHTNDFNNEWYFRYVEVSASPPPPPPPPPTPTSKPPLAAGSVAVLKVSSANSTVIGTIGVTGASAAGSITAYPCAEGRPATVSVSFRPGAGARVTTYVRSDSAGKICLHTTQSAHVTFDERLVTVVMAIHNGVTRLDTSTAQDGAARTVAGQMRRIPTGVPNKTAVGTLTVSSAERSGFAAVVPCGAPWPGTSTLNFSPGQAVSNTAVAKADGQGFVCVYTSSPVHVRWDQVAETITIPMASPKRDFDTRARSFFGGVQFPAFASGPFLTVEPNRSVFGNLTVVGADTAGYITIYPCASPRPTIGSIAFAPGERVANFVATASDANGKVCVHSTARTHIVWDTIGTTHWYQVQPPVRTYNTLG
jgi:cell wall-associated NlpC family hydrolase